MKRAYSKRGRTRRVASVRIAAEERGILQPAPVKRRQTTFKATPQGTLHVFCPKCRKTFSLEEHLWAWACKRVCPDCGTPLLRTGTEPSHNGHAAQSKSRFWAQFGVSTYQDYLHTDLWKEIRARVLKRDRRICQVCKKRASTVHHRSYSLKTLRGKDISKLISLCRKCHKKVHFNPKTGKRRPSLDAAEQALQRLLDKPKKSRPKRRNRKRLKRKQQRSRRLVTPAATATS